ncbi:MAG TPA: ribose-phosphate diphosphokinase [Alphaproteobacteria bacterium]|nr:ribose-phosphate diphosphokinase [Alphaproteobacteria bacterium]
MAARGRNEPAAKAGVHCFAESEAAARRLAGIMGASCQRIEVHVFPDGERRVKVAATGAQAILYRSLNDARARDPDDKLMEVLLAASALRANGARRVTLVAPYLPYMRQDIAFHPGEAVSQMLVGRLLGQSFDAVIAVDPHLHRIRKLSTAVKHGTAISAAPAFVELLRKEKAPPETVIVGPDAESESQVRRLAEPLGLSFMTAEKRRRGDREVSIRLPRTPSLKGRPVVLFDDMVSTGATLCQCAVLALQAGAASVEALAVHALFGPGETGAFEAAGIKRLRSSDSLTHPTNAVFLAPLIAAALGRARRPKA